MVAGFCSTWLREKLRARTKDPADIKGLGGDRARSIVGSFKSTSGLVYGGIAACRIEAHDERLCSTAEFRMPISGGKRRNSNQEEGES